MEKSNRLKKFVAVLKIIRKRVKLSQILILILLLASNTFAWFIFSNEVSGSIDVHVRAWKVLFKDGENTIENYMSIDVDSIYPGMEDFVDDITVYNESDVSADLSYSILEAKVLDDTYITAEGYLDQKLTVDDAITSKDLENRLKEEYPFDIEFLVSKDTLDAETGVATYSVKVHWDYESGNDDFDTLWGTKAYDYRKENPDEPCISLKIKIFIAQSRGNASDSSLDNNS